MLPLFQQRKAKTSCVLVRNPASRSGLDASALAAVVAWAENAGWHVTCETTAGSGHATELAREAADRGADVLIVNGGDGTVNEAVNGLARSETALAVLPGGTANVWAKEIRSSRDPLAAMRAIVGGERRRVDIGRAGGRYFLLMAGVGLDSKIIERVNPRFKRRLGAISYVVAGIPAALGTKPWQVRMRIDEEPLETPLYWMVIGNTRSYGGFQDITYMARADDGLLDVAIMRRGGAFHLAVDGLRLLAHRHDRSPNVRYVRARVVDVETPGIPIHVDGERHGETPMRFEIEPAALAVIVPTGLRTPLFSDTTAPDGARRPR